MSVLQPGDPPSWRAFNEQGTAPVLLLCDHASNAVPKALDRLGLAEEELGRHIGWDIGAAKVGEILARRLNAPFLMSGYSRLVIDCNRRLDDPTSIPHISDGTEVPGNANLSATDAAARAEACFWPYHRAVDARIDRFVAGGVRPAIVVIHSFTPSMNGLSRPWQIGILWDDDPRLAPKLLAALRRNGEINVGDNEPYSGKSEREFTLSHHTKPHDLPRVSIEIRQDLIGSDGGVSAWAARLAPALAEALGVPLGS